MILRKLHDNWHAFVREDGTEILRFQAPPDATPEDFERFAEHLIRLAKDMRHGPN